MSAAALPDDPAHGGLAHGHADEPHGSRRGYHLGFLLSVLLTALPFALVMTHAVRDPGMAAAMVMAAAAVQVVVHMVFFLHMNTRSQGGWTFLALVFTLVLVVIALSGSLWVMYHLNTNMAPMSAQMLQAP